MTKIVGGGYTLYFPPCMQAIGKLYNHLISSIRIKLWEGGILYTFPPACMLIPSFSKSKHLLGVAGLHKFVQGQERPSLHYSFLHLFRNKLNLPPRVFSFFLGGNVTPKGE